MYNEEIKEFLNVQKVENNSYIKVKNSQNQKSLYIPPEKFLEKFTDFLKQKSYLK